MLKSKDDLIKYCKDNSVPFEEKAYFFHIFLYNQRPNFLTNNEHEYIRETGNLDGYTPPPPTERKPGNFLKPGFISDHLAFFLGKSVGTQMTRMEVSRLINKYIEVNGLKDMYNGRKINPDENLRNLLNIGLEDELTYFNLQKYLKPHFSK
uniref:DM2 domain-containing protein n=1 Tax=viral metagenome TaxID=1070528 RepID=A0A6C0KPX6_9ZZZZ